jgi:hypothetical protein
MTRKFSARGFFSIRENAYRFTASRITFAINPIPLPPSIHSQWYLTGFITSTSASTSSIRLTRKTTRKSQNRPRCMNVDVLCRSNLITSPTTNVSVWSLAFSRLATGYSSISSRYLTLLGRFNLGEYGHLDLFVYILFFVY